jgi:omega-6 fatty acid desaturase (delta-12 desaturase)
MIAGEGVRSVAGEINAPRPAREWRKVVAPYERPSNARAALQLALTWVPLAGLFWLMSHALATSIWITLALAIPAAGLLVRTFIVMHDCGHGSFCTSRRVNGIVGWIAMAT